MILDSLEDIAVREQIEQETLGLLESRKKTNEIAFL